LASRQIVNQFDIPETAGLKPNINDVIIGEEGLRVCEAFEPTHQDTVHALASPPANQCVRLASPVCLGNPDSTAVGMCCRCPLKVQNDTMPTPEFEYHLFHVLGMRLAGTS
jgi:hypothetical protein